MTVWTVDEVRALRQRALVLRTHVVAAADSDTGEAARAASMAAEQQAAAAGYGAGLQHGVAAACAPEREVDL